VADGLKRRSDLLRRVRVHGILLSFHRAADPGVDRRGVALSHEAAHARGAATGQQVVGAFGTQPVGLGKIAREVTHVECVRDGGELVHDHLGLRPSDGVGHRVRIESVSDCRLPAQLLNQLSLRFAARHPGHHMPALG